jgi:hypothetical protein
MQRPVLSGAQIDRLFTRLLVRYGAAFSERWRMLDLAVVKADWARELGRYAGSPYVLDWALERLPERAPTVIDFAQLCEQAPRHEPMARSTEPIRGPTDIELDKLRELRDGRPSRPEKQWAYDIVERHRRGERVDWYPLRMAREVVDADRAVTPEGETTP